MRIGAKRITRRMMWRLLAGVLLLCAAPWSHAAVDPDWTTPLTPFRLADNLYYVGSRDLAAYLVVTPAGNILINSNLPGSPAQIRHSIEQLGFRWSDTKVLLLSHAHFDHAGGSAAVLKQTGARLAVMEGDVDVMESGGRSDFAFGGKDRAMQFPPAHVSRVLHDGDTVSLGRVTLTAHKTPGHTKGCTTWTMRAHLPGEPADVLRNVVIVGSWSVLTSYRLTEGKRRAPSYPGIAADYRRAFATLHALPCDVFLASHGSLFGLLGKLQRMPSEGDEVWVDPEGYQRAVAGAERAFQAAFEREAVAAGR